MENSIDFNLNFKRTDSDKDDTRKESSRTKDIIKHRGFYFVKDGDFDIVWQNVLIFLLGHILYFYGLYVLVSGKLLLTWMYSKIDLP